MVKALYSLRIFIFRHSFKLTAREEIGFRKIHVFIIRLCLKARYSGTKSVEAPLNDLHFMEELIQYKNVDEKASEAAIKKNDKSSVIFGI